MDPGNEFFATGSADRTIKIWDLASGQLKLTLTGHIEQVWPPARACTCECARMHDSASAAKSHPPSACFARVGSLVLRLWLGVQVTGLALSPRHPYMFSCGLDKQVKCWDLEYNKVSPPSSLLGGPHTCVHGDTQAIAPSPAACVRAGSPLPEACCALCRSFGSTTATSAGCTRWRCIPALTSS